MPSATDEEAKMLFATNCGTCHTLAQAGTDGVVGPKTRAALAAVLAATA